jgi:hypothetical protein
MNERYRVYGKSYYEKNKDRISKSYDFEIIVLLEMIE